MEVQRPESFPWAKVTSDPKAVVGQDLREANLVLGQNDVVIGFDPLLEVA